MTSILVTGAGGYIGRATVSAALARGFRAKGIGRRAVPASWDAQVPWFTVPDGVPTPEVLNGVEAVVHLAGRAHTPVAYERGRDLFNEANFLLSVRTAEAAHAAGVRRFVFVSTIGVHGNWSTEPIDENSPIKVDTPYARSKHLAELALSARFAGSNMALCIIRSPMVYGQGAPGNFSRLARLVESGVPLPFASVHSERSFIHVRNLAAYLVQCAVTAEEGVHTFVPQDGSDWALNTLVARMAFTFGLPDRQFRFPVRLLQLAATAAGFEREINSLTRPMKISVSASAISGWVPEPAEALLHESLMRCNEQPCL